jgi:hypothetical protein
MKVICIKTLPNRISNDLFVEGNIYDTTISWVNDKDILIRSYAGPFASFDLNFFEYLDKHLDKKMNKLLNEINN